MKKIALILVAALLTGMFAGCAGTPVVYYTNCTCPVAEGNGAASVQAPAADTQPDASVPEATVAVEEAPFEGALRTGMDITCTVNKSKSATAEEAGEVSYDVTVVAVLVDENGVIVDCKLDSIGAAVKIDATGAIVGLPENIQTKNELGAAYNMVLYGGAIAEWDQQAAALANYAIGKTVEELKTGAVNESGYAADADLASSATIYLGGYVASIEAAVASAQYKGAKEGDELRLATLSKVSSSTAADAENAGNAQLDTDVVALTLEGGTTITSCVIDSLQAKVAFDATGTITSDLSAPVLTKNELGENYNMVAWGGAIAEWDQQAASFCEYVTGKTVADVAGIAVDAGTKPTDADLNTSVTIAIGGFQALIAKAAQ